MKKEKVPHFIVHEVVEYKLPATSRWIIDRAGHWAKGPATKLVEVHSGGNLTKHKIWFQIWSLFVMT